MASELQIHDLRIDIERAVEIIPPHWVDDDGIVALGRRYDPLMFERFANGTLLVSPLVGWAASTRNTELMRQIGNWSRAGSRGIVTGPDGGVGFPDGALLAPDATFISRDRWNAMDRDRTFAYAVPDAAFELLSKSDRIVATRRKMQTYLRNGVQLVVLIDCERRHVYVGVRGEESPRDLGWIDRLECAPAMPGFVLDLAAVCAASDVVREDPGQDDRSGEGTGGHPPQT